MWSDEGLEDTTIELLRLKNSAIVFGATAHEVILQRRDMQPLQLDIEYQPAKGATVANTHEQLVNNVSAWSGEEMKVVGNTATLSYENLSIRLQTTDTSVHMTLTPVAGGS